MDATEILGLMVLVGTSFAATNMDNLLLLVVLMGTYPAARLSALAGFLCAAGIVLVISALGALVGTTLDPALLGYLGVVPVIMGLRLLYQRQLRPVDGHQQDQAPASNDWLGTTALMLSNSGDTLAIFFPLMAESEPQAVLWEAAVFIVMALAWATLAIGVSRNFNAARTIAHFGERLVPWMMLAVGTYILLDTATDSLL